MTTKFLSIAAAALLATLSCGVQAQAPQGQIGISSGQPGTAGVYPGATPLIQGVPNNATIPAVVPGQCIPFPGSNDADPNLRQIKITFDQPMDTALFFWQLPTNDPSFPRVTGDPVWTNGNRTIILPVQLSAGMIYSIPINQPNLIFRGATGLYAQPGLFRFATRSAAQGGAMSMGNRNNQVGGVVTRPVNPVVVNQGQAAAANANRATAATAARPTATPVVPLIGATPVHSGQPNSLKAQQAVQQQRRNSRATPTPRTY